MKTKKILIEYGHLTLEELPASIRIQVEKNEEALAYFRRSQQVNDLLRLKNYELPPPETAGRHVYNVRTRLEAMDGLEDTAPEHFHSRWQIFGYGVAATFVLMIGAVSMQQLGRGPGAVPQRALEPLPEIAPVSPIANLPPLPEAAFESFQTAEMVSSNHFPVNMGGPDGPQYIGQ